MSRQDRAADRKLYKPFHNWNEQQMKREARDFALNNGLEDYEQYFVRGGLLNLDRRALFRDRADGLSMTDDERRFLELEYRDDRASVLFGQKRTLYTLVMLSSLAAAAQIFYAKALGLGPSR
ncbi:hypothetical protein LTR53_003859 [Teratosphaeriaceae sp. CCFEE 6253]|nr:hypothetical protein LTR53_004254 [Teratosphaeriaceae sp. CCFEE 6253]KAK3116123.1 hypothetical protein LTR53_003859 [Teratosphaeriaceae sp. CCFEE 6253]